MATGPLKVTIEGHSLMSKAMAEASAKFRDSMDRMLSEVMGMNGYMQAVSGGVLTLNDLRKAANLVGYTGEAIMTRENAERMRREDLKRQMGTVKVTEGRTRFELDEYGNPVGSVVFGIDAAVGGDRASIRTVSSCGGRYEPKNAPSLYGDHGAGLNGGRVGWAILDEFYEDSRRIDPRVSFDAERVVARCIAGQDREDELTATICARDTARHRRNTALPSRKLVANMHRNDRVVLRLDREDALDGGL